jgi:hypothetical protein
MWLLPCTQPTDAVNEGVIFAAHRPGRAACNFFQRYLATYEALCRSREVLTVYGDIRRWRGGQLALNGAAAAVGVLSELDQRSLSGALVRCFIMRTTIL